GHSNELLDTDRVATDEPSVTDLPQVNVDVLCCPFIERPHRGFDESGVVDASTFIIDMGPQSNECQTGFMGEVSDGEAGEEVGLDGSDAGHERHPRCFLNAVGDWQGAA